MPHKEYQYLKSAKNRMVAVQNQNREFPFVPQNILQNKKLFLPLCRSLLNRFDYRITPTTYYCVG
jgi:hypothetical protein